MQEESKEHKANVIRVRIQHGNSREHDLLRAINNTDVMEVRMRGIVAMLALIGATMAGCLQVQPQPPLPATTMNSWGPAGGFTLQLAGMRAV